MTEHETLCAKLSLKFGRAGHVQIQSHREVAWTVCATKPMRRVEALTTFPGIGCFGCWCGPIAFHVSAVCLQHLTGQQWPGRSIPRGAS